jgi:hypothetical protein
LDSKLLAESFAISIVIALIEPLLETLSPVPQRRYYLGIYCKCGNKSTCASIITPKGWCSMEKSIGLSSQFVMALMLVAFSSAASIASGDARATHAKPKSGAVASTTNAAGAKKSLPESTALMQHDDVLPTQNRTQAMALEAENGKLPQGQEDELKRQGLIKKSR